MLLCSRRLPCAGVMVTWLYGPSRERGSEAQSSLYIFSTRRVCVAHCAGVRTAADWHSYVSVQRTCGSLKCGSNTFLCVSLPSSLYSLRLPSSGAVYSSSPIPLLTSLGKPNTTKDERSAWQAQEVNTNPCTPARVPRAIHRAEREPISLSVRTITKFSETGLTTLRFILSNRAFWAFTKGVISSMRRMGHTAGSPEAATRYRDCHSTLSTVPRRCDQPYS